MFWKIRSKEYLELFEMFEKLRIKVEVIQLDLESYKQKMNAKKFPKAQTEDKKDLKDSMLLPD